MALGNLLNATCVWVRTLTVCDWSSLFTWVHYFLYASQTTIPNQVASTNEPLLSLLTPWNAAASVIYNQKFFTQWSWLYTMFTNRVIEKLCVYHRLHKIRRLKEGINRAGKCSRIKRAYISRYTVLVLIFEVIRNNRPVRNKGQQFIMSWVFCYIYT